ncbi:MAG: nucleotidyltransferase family protein [Anaerolineales bacterium]|nr:nucleotidyltransferase family protein [Anaerolineales bacterium]MBX3005800.1 nucleotidyltransferase family protein [Anaerolineales bacterium]
MKVDALLSAGGIPQPGESLYEFSQGRSKALIEIAGKPMVQWILDALSQAQHIGNVVIVGLSEADGLTCEKPLSYVPNQGEMLPNIRAGARKIVELNPEASYCVLVPSDTPAISGAMVDWVLGQLRVPEDEMLYNVVTREVMEARFPDSRRTFTRLKDAEVCGGDITPVALSVILSSGGTWEKLSAARKSPLKQAALIGFDTLFLALIRQLSIAAAAQRASRSLGLRARAQFCPYAEIGMDVDKAHHLEVMRAYLEAKR